MRNRTALLLASKGNEADRIAAFCRKAFSQVEAYHGDWGQPIPEECSWWRGDIIISYCSRWIVPKHLLERAAFAEINFHPAPPEYPGIGGINWALYENADSFGVTCHQMAPEVDAGPIIEVRRFPVLTADDVASLFSRTHTHLEALTYDMLGALATGGDLPTSTERWSGPRRDRRELNGLAAIAPEMSTAEVARRVRATHFGNWKPTVTLGEFTFELKT